MLFTGWSTADTHAGPSNLRYGLDNWLYGIVGIDCTKRDPLVDPFDKLKATLGTPLASAIDAR